MLAMVPVSPVARGSDIPPPRSSAMTRPRSAAGGWVREILADDRLGRVFGKDRVTMFEMNRHLARHLA
jgi:chromatin remodeling complex protein RSC6